MSHGADGPCRSPIPVVRGVSCGHVPILSGCVERGRARRRAPWPIAHQPALWDGRSLWWLCAVWGIRRARRTGSNILRLFRSCWHGRPVGV